MGAIIFLRGAMNMSSQLYDVHLSICQQESQTMTFYIPVSRLPALAGLPARLPVKYQNNKLPFVIQLCSLVFMERFLFFPLVDYFNFIR